MKQLLAAALVAMSVGAFAAPAGADEAKFGYTHDHVKHVKYGHDFILVKLAKYSKAGEYGCQDPYYKISHELFGGTYTKVVDLVTQAAMYGAKIGLHVAQCAGEGKEGVSVVSEVKIDFHGGQYDGDQRSGDYRGSYR